MRETVGGTVYETVRLLGKGKGGYSYLARTPDGEEIVLKKIHHEPCDYYTFGDKMRAELADYERLLSADIPMPRMLGDDEKQEIILKEYIPGPTAYELILGGNLPEWCLARAEEIAEQARSAGLNIDYFPTNFIPYNDTLYYVDYECNPYEERWDFAHWGRAWWSLTPQLLQHAREHGDL